MNLHPIAAQILAHENCLVGLRHGQTEFNLEDRLTTVTDVPLTEHGESQARRVAPTFAGVHFDRVAASPKKRARTTAELATVHCTMDTRIVADEKLIEPNAGPFEGLTFTELREGDYAADYAAYCDPESPVYPVGAEPVTETAERAQSVLDWARGAGGRTLIVSHGAFLRILTCVVIGADPHHYRRLKLDNCGLIVVKFYPSPPNQLVAFNLKA
jgi:broad specificity phosphatase PhoE